MIYPNMEVFAQAMFGEAVRHLEDAHLLHKAGRLPGAITSSMKSAELGFKSALILEGTFGWWENALTSHSPVSDATGHPVLKQVVSRFSPSVMSLIKEMELLSPSKIGKKAFGSQNQDERNPEYPFVVFDQVNIRWGTPTSSFVDPRISHNYCEAARDLLGEIVLLYPSASQWDSVLPLAMPDPDLE